MVNSVSEPAVGLLRLHVKDNVAVLAQAVGRGDAMTLDSMTFTAPADLEMGHKIALTAIPAGADVLKYGAPIGFASSDIAQGEHVHLHNIASRYTVVEDMKAESK
ncbi:MAG: UxaA family hydrolase [Paracoccaceae bacterium]